MLAQNFKTSAELGISEIEHTALIQTLGYLERGDLPGELNLNLWCVEDDQCGTVACIAGWAWHFSGKKAFLDIVGDDGIGGTDRTWMDKRSVALRALFLASAKYERCAAIGLRNFLRTGEPHWAEARASE